VVTVCGMLRAPSGFLGILFISWQVFRATCSDPAWFGGGHLSDFAPTTARPYHKIERPDNPQVGANYIIWSYAILSRVSPVRLPDGGFRPQ